METVVGFLNPRPSCCQAFLKYRDQERFSRFWNHTFSRGASTLGEWDCWSHHGSGSDDQGLGKIMGRSYLSKPYTDAALVRPKQLLITTVGARRVIHLVAPLQITPQRSCVGGPRRVSRQIQTRNGSRLCSR